jgi:hypothetical protein
MGMWWVGWRQEGGKPRREEGNKKILNWWISSFGSARASSGPIRACEQPFGYLQQGNPKGETKGLFAYCYSVYVTYGFESFSNSTPKTKKIHF